MKYVLRQLLRRLCMSLFNGMAIAGNVQIHRLWLLRLMGIRVGNGVHLNEQLYFLHGFNIEIGRKCNLGAFLKIVDYEPVSIGDNVLMSNNVTIISGSHNTIDFNAIKGPVIIGSNCWIGAGVTLIGPCTVGEGTVIGAGAVVVKDLPSFSICVGVPAKKIKNRPCKS